MIENGSKASQRFFYLFFYLFGSIVYWVAPSEITTVAEVSTTFFTNALKLVSLPIIFLSIVATFAKMDNFQTIGNLFKRIFFYTILSTLIASSIALLIYLALKPAASFHSVPIPTGNPSQQMSYIKYLLQIIPHNIIQPFYENNVIGVLILAFFIGTSILFLPKENRLVLEPIFASLYAVIVNIVQVVVRTLPFISFAFLILLLRDLNSQLNLYGISKYLLALVTANLSQAFIILPLFLLVKKISPFKVFKAVFPALATAFFSKSSAAAMPTAIQCAEGNLGISKNVTRISFPLCTTINMNACAAFILITFLFVSQVEGITFSPLELVGWIFISTLAAIGNAGVPMGCYFLTMSLLSSMNIPVSLLGAILPFYALLDMLESAINLWSDACVTVIVDKGLAQKLAFSENSKPITV